MIANTNEVTGIPYGIISANSIHGDVLHELLYTHGKDLSQEAANEEEVARQKAEWEDKCEQICVEAQEAGVVTPMFDDFEPNLEDFEPSIDEPIIEGVKDGVHYRTTWLGGAQLVWVFMSPVLMKCSVCSPCVPGAGDLDSIGSYQAYGVPADWLDEVFMRQKCEDDGYVFCDGPEYHWRDAGNDEVHGGPFASFSEALEDCFKTNLLVPVP